MTADLLMLLALPLLIVASGFFSGSETALFSLTRRQRADLAMVKGGSVAAATVTRLLGETRPLLITLLLGNMTINVLFFVLSSMLLMRLGETWARPTPGQAALLAAAALAPLLSIILLGEVLPKLVAARLSVGWSRWVAVPMMVVHRVLAPVRIAGAVLVITPLARLIAPREATPELSSDELEAMLDASQRTGVIDADEERILQEVLELSQLKVRDLMVPRVDIEAHHLADGPDALLALIRRTRLRHIPVYRDDLDTIEGVIHSREALLHPPGSGLELNALVRPITFVPEQQRADQLLRDLQRTGGAFAIVVDEYGGTAGLIAIEDVIEHMVGGLPTSYEQGHEPRVEHLPDGRWRVEADLAIHDWHEVIGKDRALGGAAEHADVSTVGGLVMSRLGRLPAVGDAIQISNVRFTVEAMDGRRIDAVMIELADRPTHPEQGAA